MGEQFHMEKGISALSLNASVALQLRTLRERSDPVALYEYLRPVLKEDGFDHVVEVLEEVKRLSQNGDQAWLFAVESLTLLYDRVYDTGSKKRSSLLHLYMDALNEMFSRVPLLGKVLQYSRVDWSHSKSLTFPQRPSQALLVDASEFPFEGDSSAARFVLEAYKQGWKQYDNGLAKPPHANAGNDFADEYYLSANVIEGKVSVLSMLDSGGVALVGRAQRDLERRLGPRQRRERSMWEWSTDRGRRFIRPPPAKSI